MIIVFNVKKLAKKLANNELRETHKLFYFIVPLIFMYASHSIDTTLLSVGISIQDPALITLRVINALFTGLFIFVGVIWIWLINRQGDQKNFIERFICLSFPIQIYLALTAILIQIGFYFLFLTPNAPFSPSGHRYAIASLILKDVLLILYFLLLGHWIKRLSHRRL